jgi:hypothetical protein
MVEGSMDRSDELRDNRSADASSDNDERITREGDVLGLGDTPVPNAPGDPTSDNDERMARDGDVLGLGGTPVPKAPGDPTTEYDEESVAQRRSRALGEEEVRRRSDDDFGATGIDMGAGGHGTDLSGE